MHVNYPDEINKLNSDSGFFKNLETVSGFILGIIGIIATIAPWFTSQSPKVQIIESIVIAFVFILILFIKNSIHLKKYKALVTALETENRKLSTELKDLNNNKPIILADKDKYKKQFAAYRRAFRSIANHIGTLNINLAGVPAVMGLVESLKSVERTLHRELEDK